MSISKADSQKMQRLAQEGKKISSIWKKDFPSLTYYDVYFEVYGAGERSALGIKRMITSRIKAIAESAGQPEREEIATELQELVWRIYSNHQTNQKKLEKIREALNE